MKKYTSLLALYFIILGLANAQKTADEYLKQAPIQLPKDVCSMSLVECDLFSNTLKAYTDSLFSEINSIAQNITEIPLNAGNMEEANRISAKIIDVSYKYTEKYYCLVNLCNSMPEVLSGDELTQALVLQAKIKTLIEFNNNLISGRAKESENPGWRAELKQAENTFCAILSPKYEKLLADQKEEVTLLLPECRTLSSFTGTGTPEAREIEALRTIHNYLTTFNTNIFLGKMELVFR